jgi:glycosyltransferase involved in cell wall biosynthesis
MKLAIIGSRGYPYVYSGYETFVRELGERLADYGIQVTVYCHRNLFKEKPVEVNGIRLVYLPTIERKNLSQFLHSFQSILHACLSGADVILAVNVANAPLGIFTKIFRRKSFINVDGLEWLRPKWKGLGAKYFYFCARFASLFFDRVITDSARMQHIYREEFNIDSVMIAYGANKNFRKDDNAHLEFGVDRDEYYLVVGRIIPDNNLGLIIKEFCKSKTNKKLVVVGDVPRDDCYSRELKRNTDKRLVFTGYIRKPQLLTELYLNSFMYLHGHEFGGTNPGLLEALGCGCAVAALDTQFTREMLKDGDFGMFFSKDEGNLKKLIESSELNLPEIIGLRAKAYKRIDEQYSWEKVVGQYIELFKEAGRML